MSDIIDDVRKLNRGETNANIERELKRQRKIEYESDYNMGRIAIRLKLKVSRDNLFMDDVTREELK